MARLRMGMIGGGPGSFIGPVHRMAAELDGEIELIAGAFSSNPDRSREGGAQYGVDPTRAYPSLEAMIEAERVREDPIDFVAIVTPNHHHLRAAKVALEAGIPVISEKPATATLDQARELVQIVADTGLPYGVTYTYSGYPLIREARTRIVAGALGAVRKVVVEYPQGWLAGPAAGKQAQWRVDPEQAGPGGCVGDIGVHAFHLAEFVTGLRVTRLLADLAAIVPGRRLDDDCAVLLRFENGARGVLLASQVAVGERNALRIRVYGERGGLDWRQEDPNYLIHYRVDGATEWVRAGDANLSRDARAATRLPGGHPEGYLEAFANLYRDFARTLRHEEGSLLPGVDAGLRGVLFVATAVIASREDRGWVDLHN